MRQARQRQFDPSDPPWLHCISRCVRRAYLCGDGYDHRKGWLERRLRLLARCFAVEVGAYAIMSNHLHVVLRPRPQETQLLDDHAVATAWWQARHNVDLREEPQNRPPQGLIEALVKDNGFISRWRERLGSLSWFMKAVKEPLSRMANKEDECSGTFWEGRFTSVPLLDQAAVVACMAYVDLNPIRAQLAEAPESSDFTSVKTRISAEREKIDLDWLAPLPAITAPRAGIPGLSLHHYLELVDATGRVLRGDKRGAIDPRLPAILARLESTVPVDAWCASVGAIRGLRGSALGQASALAAEAARRGLRWIQRRCHLGDGGDTVAG